MDISEITGRADFAADITGISYDSRKAKSGDLFVCLKGFNSDGHRFAKNAYDNGARVFAVQDGIELPDDAKIIRCDDTRRALALYSAAFFGHPSRSMYVVGITGTKGKTSTSFMLKRIFECAGKKVGIIGTTGIYYGDTFEETGNSTPESYILQETLAKMRDHGCDVAVMEASSQGFKLCRTDGIMFDAGVFTNISPDHISPTEHRDFDDYLACKCRIFDQCRHAYINADSDRLDEIMSRVHTPHTTFGIENSADIHISDENFVSEHGKMYTEFFCTESDVRHAMVCNMPGRFSLYNAAAAIAVSRGAGIDWDCIKRGLSDVYVKGRMEVVPTNTPYTVIIDFAHNAVSCENLFETIKQYGPKRIISVFGCGGQRSVTRRYGMGQVIGTYSDISIVTADNPRMEALENINKDIKVSLDKTDTVQVYIDDRADAIRYALDTAQPGDCVLLIGKGHESSQDIYGVVTPFNERQIVLDHLRKASL